MRSRSTRTSAEQYDLDSLKQDQEIERKRAILDVKEVVLELRARLLHSCAVMHGNLRPAGDSGAQRVAQVVKRYLLFQLVHKVRALGTRPYESHFSTQDVDELRKLVHPQFAKH